MFKKELQIVYANHCEGNGEYIIKKQNREKFIETLLKTERDFLEILENDASLWLDEGGWIYESGNPEDFEEYLKYLRKRQSEITDILFQMRKEEK